MNEYELVDSISKKINKDYEETKVTIQAMLDCITEELVKGGKVKLVDFGSFEVAESSERKGYQPYYKKIIIIPACKKPIFRAGKAFKEIIANS